MARTVTKPRPGKPQTEAQRVAVLEMEREVVQRHAVQGQSFYAIERELGITNADRIYKRAMSTRPMVEREEAAKAQAMRLEALHAQAWAALTEDGLDGLALRVAEILRETDAHGLSWEDVPERVQSVIESAYADTYRAIPVALQVSDRMVKLAGLDHAARVADAQLEIDAGKVRVLAAALVSALEDDDVPTAARARIVRRYGELLAAAQDDTPE